jgi:hypothetical protein
MKWRLVFCEVCGECLGEETPYYAEEHLRLHPDHRRFLVKTILDPLLSDNPDEWFNYHIPLMRRNLTERKADKDLTESLPEMLNISTLKYGIGR